MYVFVFGVVFFFFKQKTAYEMRISDWSSDVCSSDLVERRMRGEISARTDATGQELTSVNADQVRTVVGRLVQEGAKSIAVCLLHSYASAAHERQVRDLIAAAFPSVDITLSSDVAPVARAIGRAHV